MEDDTPDTVTEAVQLLQAKGYTDNLDIEPGCIVCSGHAPHSLAGAVVDHQFRFEGDSDPGDESIVLGLSLPEWGTKGILVSGYGPSAPPDKAAALLALVR
jgi:hypothetical protein